VDIPDILALYDKHQRIEIEFPGVRKEVQPHVVRFVRAMPGMNFVLYSALDEPNVDRVIEEQIAYYTQMDQPFEWKVFDHDRPPDLRQRLVSRGFEAEEPDAVMVLDLQQVPPTLLEPVVVDIRPILERAQLDDVVTVEEQVWGGEFSWIGERLGDHLHVPGYLSVYVAYVGDRPASSGWIYFHGNGLFADLWGGSTVPEFRHRGLYSAILAIRVQQAIQRGYRFLTIDAGPMSRPIVAKHGFRLLAVAHACQWIGTPG
jgi:hypothetical protein